IPILEAWEASVESPGFLEESPFDQGYVGPDIVRDHEAPDRTPTLRVGFPVDDEPDVRPQDSLAAIDDARPGLLHPRMLQLELVGSPDAIIIVEGQKRSSCDRGTLISRHGGAHRARVPDNPHPLVSRG